jgi:hypothetical protein
LFITRAKKVLNDLEEKKVKLPQEFTLNWILNGLPTFFEGFVGNVTQALRKDPSSYTLYTLCDSIIDESQRLKGDPKLLFTKKGYKNHFNSSNGVKKSYSKKNEYKKTKGVYCRHCEQPSHRTETCFYLFPERAPEWWDSKKNPSNTPTATPSFKNKEKSGREKREDKILAFTQKCAEYSAKKQKEAETREKNKRITTPVFEEINYSQPSTPRSPEREIGPTETEDIIMREEEDDLFDFEAYQVFNTTLPIQKETITKTYNLGDLEILQKEVLAIKDRLNSYSSKFIFDTGAEIHVISDRSLFCSFNNKDKTTLS